MHNTAIPPTDPWGFAFRSRMCPDRIRTAHLTQDSKTPTPKLLLVGGQKESFLFQKLPDSNCTRVQRYRSRSHGLLGISRRLHSPVKAGRLALPKPVCSKTPEQHKCLSILQEFTESKPTTAMHLTTILLSTVDHIYNTGPKRYGAGKGHTVEKGGKKKGKAREEKQELQENT